LSLTELTHAQLLSSLGRLLRLRRLLWLHLFENVTGNLW
jgi:hypothetical protein